MRKAKASVCATKSASSTQAHTKPHFSACSADKRSPSKLKPTARARPAERCKNQVLPKSGTMPKRGMKGK